MTPLSVEHEGIVKTLRLRRESLGLTQAALAGQIGMRKQNLCEMELGKRPPRLGTLIRWARALDCKVEVTPR